MPVQPTYPGVYIEEVPSGVRTITGVATSVTAFVGYTKKGPLNEPRIILSYSDFERTFGGLSRESTLSYAVHHFFLHGGQQAIVVRVVEGNSALLSEIVLGQMTSTPASPVEALKVIAKERGAWANGISIAVDYDTQHPESTFNLRVVEPMGGKTEEFLGVSMNSASQRYVQSVVNHGSQLIEVVVEQATLDSVTAKGTSTSGEPIEATDVNEDHYQFMIELDEGIGPQLVEIYSGVGDGPQTLDDVATNIQLAVTDLVPGNPAYDAFECRKVFDEEQLEFESGLTGDASFVRLSSAPTKDAAARLKLGVTHGGREIDGAASIRPAPVGTVSARHDDSPTLTVGNRIAVTVDDDGPHQVIVRVGDDEDTENLGEVAARLQDKLTTQVTPNQQGSTVFMGIKADVFGRRIRIRSGAEDRNSIVKIENGYDVTDLNSVFFLSATHGWAVGKDGLLLYTTDGGATWEKSLAADLPDKNLTDVFFRTNADDSVHGWIVGENGTILRSTDGGETWSTPASVPAGLTAHLNSVHFTSDTAGLIVGDASVILVTDDEGGTWSASAGIPPEITPAIDLNCVRFRTGTARAWVAGSDGTILYSTDSGANWALQEVPGGWATNLPNLRSISHKAVTDGIVVGDGGAIGRVTSEGGTWTLPIAVPTGLSANLRSVHYLSDTLAWAVGDGGTILISSDKGVNWVVPDEMPSGPTVDLHAVRFLDAENGWVVGDGGMIWKAEYSAGEWVWSQQKPVEDDTAENTLKLTGADSIQNVKAYTLGIGKPLGAQSGAAAGTDGNPPKANDFKGNSSAKTGIYALLDADIFNILCLPEVGDLGLNDQTSVLAEAVSFCKDERAFLVIDAPKTWLKAADAVNKLSDYDSIRSENAAMYYPRVIMPDPLDENRPRSFPACGMVAGVYARTDVTRGIWKAPAGQNDGRLTGVSALGYKLTDEENGLLNPLGLNCFRIFPIVGPTIWGARTLVGADVLASEWKYIPVRRLALFIEETLFRGTQWVVFEPNDEPLWAQIRLNVGAFMQTLFRQGAFQGSSPREAYFVKCDNETTTQSDIDRGIVNILVGFAPLKPAEFVIIKISQIAGELET